MLFGMIAALVVASTGVSPRTWFGLTLVLVLAHVATMKA